MNSKLDLYLISFNDTVESALLKLEDNKKRFLIVISAGGLVLGTLTDGDVRRSFLSGFSLTEQVEKCCNKNFESLLLTDDFFVVCERFKKSNIDFLPILNDNGNLVNVLTRSQFHILMLEDICFDLEFDFNSLDNLQTECDINNRPWGFYKSTLLTSHAQSKIITIFPLQSISLQKHNMREEHWVVIKGEGEITLGDSVLNAYPGKYIYIPKGCKHRAKNTSKKENLIFAEVQLGSYFGEDDIIRYEDIYNRVI